MALDKPGLQAALTDFFTPPEFGGGLPAGTEDPADHQSACAQLWADAMQTYVQAMEPLHLAALGSASANLKTALESVFATWLSLDDYPSDNCALINAAFDAFASEIALSVGTETSGRTSGLPRLFIGTPPPGINFCSLGNADDYATAAANVATLIDSWFTQGVSDTTDDSPPTKPHLTLPWI